MEKALGGGANLDVLLEVDARLVESKLELGSCREEGGAGREVVFI